MDSFAIKKDRPDIFDMPLPVYKASIKEEKDTVDRFIFYFYDIPELDTIFKTIFGRVMINHLRAGFGTAKANYVFATPQFDRTGKKLIVYAVSLSIADEKYVGDKEKKIREIFELQKTTIRDLKLEDLEDEKK